MRLHAPYLLLYDGSEAARRGLALVGSLLPPSGQLLLVIGDDARHRQEVVPLLPLAVAWRTRLLVLAGRRGVGLSALVKAERVGLVITALPSASAWLSALDTPVLVVQ
jgi:hypothetical protein